jgi:hypothetical protein
MTYSPIPGFLGYSATADGDIISPSGKKLIPNINAKGYGRVVVGSRTHGTRARMNVHQLVALAFLGARPIGQEVRHLNDIKTDNRLANLAYGTRRENVQDALKNGLIPLGAEHRDAVMDATRVELIKVARAAGIPYIRIASALRVSDQTVRKVVSGNHWTSSMEGHCQGGSGYSSTSANPA